VFQTDECDCSLALLSLLRTLIHRSLKFAQKSQETSNFLNPVFFQYIEILKNAQNAQTIGLNSGQENFPISPTILRRGRKVSNFAQFYPFREANGAMDQKSKTLLYSSDV